MFGQFTGQKETHGSLDLAACDGRPLVVVGQTRRFSSDALENVVHERVHDGHGLGRDASVGMDLLQHFVDVDCVTFLPLALLLLVALCDVLLGLARFLCCFAANLRRHCRELRVEMRVQRELNVEQLKI